MNEEVKFFVDVLKGVVVTSFAAAVFRDASVAAKVVYGVIGLAAFFLAWRLVRQHR